MTIVDGDLADQHRLERLLEASKPAGVPGTESLHYLLATPFRYPPLRHGSRFGSTLESSLFYGSASVAVALAETAYYRFVFRADAADLPARIVTRHTVFEASWATPSGLRLQAAPFDAWRRELTDPADYSSTQALGTALRAEGVEAIEFVSARAPGGGLNVALFVPAALAANAPRAERAWLCTTSDTEVVFRSRTRPASLMRFDRETFVVDGRLPRPA